MGSPARNQGAMRNLLIWLEGSAVAVGMRESSWLYPLVETLHILGFVVLVGAAAMFDLRLLGISRSLSVIGLARHLLPWARAGLALAAPTGLLLFLSDATALASNPALQAKLVALGLGIVNTLVFHWRSFAAVDSWDRDAPTPAGARAAALVSLGAWTATIALGRLIAYV